MMSQLDLARLHAANARLSALRSRKAAAAPQKTLTLPSPLPKASGGEETALEPLPMGEDRVEGFYNFLYRDRDSVAPKNAAVVDPVKPESWLQAAVEGLQNPVKVEPVDEQTASPSNLWEIASRDENLSSGVIAFYPDLGLAMLREEVAAIGRIWLLLRHVDLVGKGWISIEEARALLTKKGSSLRVCGWRQLRNLLRAGQGLFWERDKERIWLRSVAKVAMALGVERMEYRPIALPVTSLLDGIGSVRAHFYASFHSSRYDPDHAKPVARDTLTMLSGIGRDSQRSYEKQTNTTAQSNFAVGRIATSDTHKEACWQHGNHIFILKDAKGKQGVKGQKYVAWQLPNSYDGTHCRLARGLKRRINRKLADLLTYGAMGNDEQMRTRRYVHSGAEVCVEKNSAAEKIYLRSARRGKVATWQCF